MFIIILLNIVVSACTATCHNQHENPNCISSISNKSQNLTRAPNNGTMEGNNQNKVTTTNFQDKDIRTSSSSPFTMFQMTYFKTEDLNLQVLESTSTTTVITQPDDTDKIISIVVPFASIIGTALVLVVIYRLARKYNCCITKDCLDQCSAFCESCMTAPYMYQPQCQQQGAATGPPSPHKLLMHKAPALVRREAEARTSRTKKAKKTGSSSGHSDSTPESLVLQQPLNV